MTLIIGIGTGRCGTLFITEFLKKYLPNSLVLHEGYLKNNQNKEKELLPYLTLDQRNVYLGKQDPIEVIRDKRFKKINQLLGNHSYVIDILMPIISYSQILYSFILHVIHLLSLIAAQPAKFLTLLLLDGWHGHQFLLLRDLCS